MSSENLDFFDRTVGKEDKHSFFFVEFKRLNSKMIFQTQNALIIKSGSYFYYFSFVRAKEIILTFLMKLHVSYHLAVHEPLFIFHLPEIQLILSEY